MSKHLFHLRDIGHAGIWRILRSANDHMAPEAAPESMKDASVPLLFAEYAPQERLIQTLSIRGMGGEEIYFGPGEWPGGVCDPRNFAFNQAGPLCVVNGLPLGALAAMAAFDGCSLVNGGGPDAHPCRLLADMILIREKQPELDSVRIAWVGGANGLAHSLVEAAMFIPFELFMALPEWGEPDRELLSLAFAAGAKIFLTRDIHMAVDGAHYIYAGRKARGPEESARETAMLIDEAVMDIARPEARLLLGQETGHCAEDAVLAMRAALERKHFSMRLMAQRLIWNWLLRESEEL